jgi:thiol-disulfide isomerase/thioredoxin
MTNKPFFPSDPQEQQPSGQNSFLIGSACVLGAALMMAMFIGLALFKMHTRTGKPCCVPAESEEINSGHIEDSTVGTDFNLYGKTLNDEDFDWESLRGKYVLVKFTATWCGPCQGEIPGMLKAYEQYHDKGLEIVSVYIWQREPDPVATVKKYVEEKKLPWIIVSESLTVKSGQPPYRETFGIQRVPTMLLVDKEGKVHATNTRGEVLRRTLKKLFDE